MWISILLLFGFSNAITTPLDGVKGFNFETLGAKAIFSTTASCNTGLSSRKQMGDILDSDTFLMLQMGKFNFERMDRFLLGLNLDADFTVRTLLQKRLYQSAAQDLLDAHASAQPEATFEYVEESIHSCTVDDAELTEDDAELTEEFAAALDNLVKNPSETVAQQLVEEFGSFYFKTMTTGIQEIKVGSSIVWKAEDEGLSHKGQLIIGGAIQPISHLLINRVANCQCNVWFHRNPDCEKLCQAIHMTETQIASLVTKAYRSLRAALPCAIDKCEIPGSICLPQGKCKAPKMGIEAQVQWDFKTVPTCHNMILHLDNFIGQFGRQKSEETTYDELPKSIKSLAGIRIKSYECEVPFLLSGKGAVPNTCNNYFQIRKTLQSQRGYVSITQHPGTFNCSKGVVGAAGSERLGIRVEEIFGNQIEPGFLGHLGHFHSENTKSAAEYSIRYQSGSPFEQEIECGTNGVGCPLCRPDPPGFTVSRTRVLSGTVVYEFTDCRTKPAQASQGDGYQGKASIMFPPGTAFFIAASRCKFDEPTELSLPVKFENSDKHSYVIPTKLNLVSSKNNAICSKAVEWYPLKDFFEGRASAVGGEGNLNGSNTKYDMKGYIYIDTSGVYKIRILGISPFSIQMGNGPTHMSNTAALFTEFLAKGYTRVVIRGEFERILGAVSISIESPVKRRVWGKAASTIEYFRKTRMDFRYSRHTKKWVQSASDQNALRLQDLVHKWVTSVLQNTPFPLPADELKLDGYGIVLPESLQFSNAIDAYIYLVSWVVQHYPDESQATLPDLGRRIDLNPIWQLESVANKDISKLEDFEKTLLNALKVTGKTQRHSELMRMAIAEFALRHPATPSTSRAAFRVKKFVLAVNEAYAAIQSNQINWAEAFVHLEELKGLYNVKPSDPDTEEYWFIEAIRSIRSSSTNPDICESSATLAELVILQKIPQPIVNAAYTASGQADKELGSGVLDHLSNEIVKIFRTSKSFAALRELIETGSCFRGVATPLKDICVNQQSTDPLCDLYRIFEQLSVFVTYRVGVSNIVSLKSNANLDLKTYLNEIVESNANSEMAFLIYDEVERAKLSVNKGLIQVSDQLSENFQALGQHFINVASFDLELAKLDVQKNSRSLFERKAIFEDLPLENYINDIFVMVDLALDADLVIESAQLVASVAQGVAAGFTLDPDAAVAAGKQAVEEASNIAGIKLKGDELEFLRVKFTSIQATLATALANLENMYLVIKEMNATTFPILYADDFSQISTTQGSFLDAYGLYYPPLNNTVIEGLRGDFEAIAATACDTLSETRGAAQVSAQIDNRIKGNVEYPCISVQAVIGSFFDELIWMMDDTETFIESLVDLVRGAVVGASAENFRAEVAASVGVKTISPLKSQLQALLGVIMSQIEVQKGSVMVCRHFMYSEGGANGRFELCEQAIEQGLFFNAKEIIHLLSHDPHSTGYTVTRNVYLPTVPSHDRDSAYIDMQRLKSTGRASFDLPLDPEWLLRHNFISREVDLENHAYYVRSFELYIPVVTDVSKTHPKTVGYRRTETYLRIRSSLVSGPDGRINPADPNVYEVPASTSTLIYGNEHPHIWCASEDIFRNPFAVCSPNLTNICIKSSGTAQVKESSPILSSLFTRWHFQIELTGAEPGETIYPLIPLSSTEINIPASITLYVLKLDDEDLLLEEDNSESESVSDVCCPVGSYKPRWDGFKCEPCPEYSSTALGGAYCALDVDTVQNKLDCDQDIIFELNRKVTNYAGKKQPEPNAFCKNYNYLRNKKTLNQNQELGQENIEMVSDQALDGSLRLALYLTDQQN